MDAEADGGSKKRKSGRKDKKLKELKRLEKLVLGNPSHLFEEQPSPIKKVKKHDSSLDSCVSGDEIIKDAASDDGNLKSVWVDEDDLTTCIKSAHKLQGRPNIQHPGKPIDRYDSLLKRRFESIVGNPEWAKLKAGSDNSKKDCDSDDEEDNILQAGGNVLEKRKNLSTGTIHYSTMKELNAETGREGKIIKAVEFHPKSAVALVAGFSGVATLFEVNGKTNPKIQMIKFPRFNIHCARFTHDGDQIIVGSKRHRHFYSYNMMSGRSLLIPTHHETGITNMENFEISPDGKIMAVCGRFGSIHLVSIKTKECLESLKMNSGVNAISFNNDGSRLYSFGDDGQVYIWNMNSRTCIHRFSDEGCLKGTSIHISPDNRLLACGSSSGVVNLYELSSVFNVDNPKPLKSLFNLTTVVSSLKFNHSSQILGMASVKKDRALRLMHYPSLSVYKNFPDPNKSTGLINCISFSPHSGYMAIGTNFSKALLFRLNYFGSY